MPLKLWNALLRGSVSHRALLTRLHGRDPKTFTVIRTMTARPEPFKHRVEHRPGFIKVGMARHAP